MLQAGAVAGAVPPCYRLDAEKATQGWSFWTDTALVPPLLPPACGRTRGTGLVPPGTLKGSVFDRLDASIRLQN